MTRLCGQSCLHGAPFEHAPQQFDVFGEGGVNFNQLAHTRDCVHHCGMVPVAEFPAVSVGCATLARFAPVPAGITQ